MATFEAESFLLAVLIQLVVIIVAARAGGWLLGRLGQPQVVGEIAAGLLLGPSLLGRLAPEISQSLFPSEAAPVFHVLGQLGLIFLMFLIGLEFEFSHLRQLGRAALLVSIAGIAAPFALGLGVAWILHPVVAADIRPLGFFLFLAVALSITAIPILGRIMIEFNIQRTRLAALTISAAAVDDALGWVLLATVTALVAGGFELLAMTRMLALGVAMTLIVLWVVRPIAIRWLRRVLAAGGGELRAGALAVVLAAVLCAAALSSWIGIFSIFGPFLLGAALWDQDDFRAAFSRRFQDFVYSFFLPIFFTYTGLRTDVGLLDSPRLWLLCALVLLAAVAGKMAGCGLAARVSGLGWRESGCVAVMMNTRALMGLIAINVGYELGVIPDAVFSMLVIMAVVTTFMTSPLLRRWMRGTELEEWYERRPGRESSRPPHVDSASSGRP